MVNPVVGGYAKTSNQRKIFRNTQKQPTKNQLKGY